MSLLVRRHVRPGDQGLALVAVLAAGMVLSLLVVTALAATTAAQSSSRRDQDWNAALAAAQAGVDDYLARLNDDANYWTYGNPAAAYSTGSAVTLPTGAAENAAFSGWRNVPSSGNRVQFRYDVDTTDFLGGGTIRLQSTGRSGDRTRTVEVTVSRRGFLDYLYFTDIEAKDPDTYSTAGGDSYDVADAWTHCAIRVADGRIDRGNYDSGLGSGTGCTSLNFVASDVLRGPVHSNDALLICGTPTFTSTVTTSYDGSRTQGRHYVRNWGACSPNVPQIAASGNDPVFATMLGLPPSANLRDEVDPAITGGSAGCLYTGPTRITFKSNGRFDVDSPWSANGGPMWCGTGNNVSIPPRGVIWVRSVPATADAYTATGVVCPSVGNNLGYPVTTSTGGVTRTDRFVYGCRSGDVFVSGRMSGQLTVGAENNVVITDDITYATNSCASSAGCNDLLGLVANNYVEIYHPYGCAANGSNCADLDTATVNVTVEAALLSVTHTIRVQNHQYGADRGTLTVRGALGQKFRGPVGTFNGSVRTGYIKDYNYDDRLRYVTPPHFIKPVESPFTVKAWAERPAAYTP